MSLFIFLYKTDQWSKIHSFSQHYLPAPGLVLLNGKMFEGVDRIYTFKLEENIKAFNIYV